MHIKSITLDGFKSYGNRVEVTGFDPAFNAITGLNGTGKSNILDSICFVLGITNLSNVRAGSLQELIYKHGQAGITKATVSITFDNRDKSQAPIGYETTDEITITRQIVMGGKNKYLINGINVQNKRVSDLFCSIQLNVNNPHFLIMQGRITKVLNMKPPEILSMIEEAAGTSMYESKKLQAQNTIAKKDSKLKELDAIITEDIAPKLQKLHDERSQFQEHQQVVREIDTLKKLYMSYQYDVASKEYEKVQEKIKGVLDDIEARKNSIKSNEKEAKSIDKEIAEINKKMNQENANILKGLETELGVLERTEASAGSVLRANREGLDSHEKRVRLLQRALHDDVAALEAKRAALDHASSTFENLRVASEQSEAALAEAQQKFLAVSSGLEGASESLQDQLMAAKQEATEASTRVSQSSMEKKAAEERLARLRKEFSASSQQFERDRSAIDHKQSQLDELASELSRMSFSSERHAALRQAARALQGSARAQRDRVDALAATLQRCDFKYSPPQPNFDASRVCGTIARLVDVCDPIYCVALETAAGGRLYNVVVDTEVTSKLLLQRGNLQARTTIIPLNKISGKVIDSRTVAIAQEIAGGADGARLALELVTYARPLRPALAWVFGAALVCRDADTAKRVCFDPRVLQRCVTLDGDVYDPSGTLTGGARARGGSTLVKIQELKKLERELQLTEQKLADSEKELTAMQRLADQYQSLKQRYDLMSHELEVVKARLATTSHAQTHAEITSLEEQVLELAANVEKDKIVQKTAAALARELEAKVKDIKGHREREFKKAEQALSIAKRDAKQHGATWKNREQELETLRLETAELERSVASSRSHLAEMQRATEALQASLEQATEEHKTALEAVSEMQARIKHQKAEISGRNSEVAQRVQRKELLTREAQDMELKIKELEYVIKDLEAEAAKWDGTMNSLVSENPWIQREKQFFGTPGGMYDFVGKQAHLAGARLAQLEARRDKLARGLNARAHLLLGKEEEQYQDLLRKKKIVEADRAKLVQVMDELDDKKRNTLIAACAQVNRDFGSIFGSLLPGAQAELVSLPGQSVLDGLEVRIGFNNTWKESLSELSGGQRSLVALSLVLAMLLFKPAPLYILDEVDAALDLSHTQNIGMMLRDHFQHSQFIIVSLKDGMFNNANVLFKTRFVDGMSSVQRTVNMR